jgi:hypothetical protein
VVVLDEHLNGIGLDRDIVRWYQGRVVNVIELRPGSIIKDDAVPLLLLAADQPIFVTLNWNHFWRRSEAHDGFCIVCFTLPTDEAAQVSDLLRQLLRLRPFRTRAARMGKVARVSGGQVSYYQTGDPEIRILPLRP